MSTDRVRDCVYLSGYAMCGIGSGGLQPCIEADGHECKFRVDYNAKPAGVPPIGDPPRGAEEGL